MPSLSPSAVVKLTPLPPGLISSARTHRQQVLDRHARSRAGRVDVRFREETAHGIVERQPASVDQHADRAGGDALGDRMRHAAPGGTVGPVPALRHHRAVAPQHDVVQLEPGRFDVVDESDDPTRGDADRAGICPRESVGVRRCGSERDDGHLWSKRKVRSERQGYRAAGRASTFLYSCCQ
jgi:hypothetical protein